MTALPTTHRFQLEKLSLEDEGEKRKVASPAKEATAGASTTDAIGDIAEAPTTEKPRGDEEKGGPYLSRDRGSSRRTTDASAAEKRQEDLIDLSTPKKLTKEQNIGENVGGRSIADILAGTDDPIVRVDRERTEWGIEPATTLVLNKIKTAFDEHLEDVSKGFGERRVLTG